MNGNDRLEEINKMIESIKQIIEERYYINLPVFGQARQLHLQSKDYMFLLDLNRKGYKKQKCTFQLREKRNKEQPLVRIDIIGKPHQNPEGDFKWANQVIDCPHLHRADFPKFGIHVAVPLLEDNNNFRLSQDDLNNLIICLKKTLKFLKVKNRNDFQFQEQGNLF